MYIKGKVMFPLCILLNTEYFTVSMTPKFLTLTWAQCINMDKLPFAGLYVRLHQS